MVKASIKLGNPHSYYSDVIPLCRYCQEDRSTKVLLWECIHQDKQDTMFIYKDPCSEKDWIICPLRLGLRLIPK